MRNINDLTGVDFEECVDPVTDQLSSTPQIVQLIHKVEELSKMYYNGSFVSADFISALGSYMIAETSDNTTQQLESFGAEILSNINVKLNE